MKKSLIQLLSFCLLFAAAGCATPERRIEKNPELFASFPLEVQENVRNGIVEIGYTMDMVYIALGNPNRKYTRKTAGGTTEVWAYTRTEYRTNRERISVDFTYRDAGNRRRTTTESVWVDVRNETEYDQTRIEFVEGSVSAIESVER